jgi:hypothetical protein
MQMMQMDLDGEMDGDIEMLQLQHIVDRIDRLTNAVLGADRGLNSQSVDLTVHVTYNIRVEQEVTLAAD